MHDESYAHIISIFIYLSEESRFKDMHKNLASFAAKLNCPSELSKDHNGTQETSGVTSAMDKIAGS
jgi:hypothetical protein